MQDLRTPTHIFTPSTFPLWPINSDGSCACGRKDCLDMGKHPRPWGDPLPGSGYGIYTGAPSGVFVVDCDEKPGQSGLENFKALCGGTLPNTLTVQTGGGGYHFYFKYPGHPVRNSVSKLAPAVDVRGDGGFVVGPDSPHKSGSHYLVSKDVPILDAPAWLLEQLQHKTPAVEGDFAPTPIDVETEEGQRRIGMYGEECKTLPAPPRPGNGGQNALFHVVARGTCYYHLPAEVVATLIEEHYNPRLNIPWTEEAVERKIFETIRTNTEFSPGPPPPGWCADLIARLSPAPLVDDGTKIKPKIHSDSHKYKCAVGESISSGELTKKPAASALASILSRHPDWIGVLQWDLLHDCIRAVDPPIRLEAERGPLTDADVIAIQVWFECEVNISVGIDTLRGILPAVAKSLPIHPIRDYLTSLPEEDPEILGGLAELWFGDPSPLSAEILTKFLVGAVRRMLIPGTQMDTMLVLHSEKQGWGKSSWVRNLFGAEWSIRQMPDLTSKDAAPQMATTWAVEFSELNKIVQTNLETVKDFLSRPDDTYRKAYGRDHITKLRAQVCIGTTNEIDFLRDASGARRFLPITLLKMINQADVISLRDRVWAAAYALALDEEYEHWINPGSALDDQLIARHTVHTQDDPWHETIANYCAGKRFVKSKEVYQIAIKKGGVDWEQSWDRKQQRRISDTLRRLGGKGSINAEGVRVVRMPDSIADMKPAAPKKSSFTVLDKRTEPS